tara:strand:+ start:17 stop:460 length:444 start_codon:yes stop_codon:yes gene_type:complete
MIKGVKINSIESHKDKRGFFREIWRFSEQNEFNPETAQISHSLVKEGVIKGWHGHVNQGQLNYVASGSIRVALYDNRNNSSTYKSLMQFNVNADKPKVYYFPPKVLHGYKCLSGLMNIIYITSSSYDLKDEIRIDFQEIDSGLDWGT